MRETELEVKTLGTGSVRGWESAHVQKPLTQAGTHHRGRKSTNDDKVSVDCGGVGIALTSFQDSLVCYFSQGAICLSFEHFCDCCALVCDLACSSVS